MPKSNGAGGVIGGIASVIGYGLFLYAMRIGSVAELATLRETSIVFAALFATLFLGERFGWVRGLAVFAICTGIIAYRLT